MAGPLDGTSAVDGTFTEGRPSMHPKPADAMGALSDESSQPKLGKSPVKRY